MVGDRHPVVESLVFGLAGVLALILAYFTYARWSAGRVDASPAIPETGSVYQRAEPNPPPVGTLKMSGTERAVSGLPMVRLSSPAPKKSKR